MLWTHIQKIFLLLFVIVLTKILCLDELDIKSNTSSVLNVLATRSTVIVDPRLSSPFPQGDVDSIEKSDHNFYLPISNISTQMSPSSNITNVTAKTSVVQKNLNFCPSYLRIFSDWSKNQSSMLILNKNESDTKLTNLTENCERPIIFFETNGTITDDLKKTSIENEKGLNISSQKEETITNQSQSSENVMEDIILIKSPHVSAKDMLSFEEWRRKISEQIDTNIDHRIRPKVDFNIDTDQVNSLNTNNQAVKLPTNRARNFASHECGAKIVDSNSEADFVNRVLNEQTDEYMLNPCKTKNWFVIELCETIQPQYLEMANFELYSSIPKEFSVYASEHYPIRNEWSKLGSFSSSDIRSVQGFKLHNNGFVKFLKIELHSYYGSEHFCPISVIRLFGTSLFDEVERIDKSDEKKNHFPSEDENSIFEESMQQISSDKSDIIGHAKKTVFNIFMKAINFNIFNRILENFSLVKDSAANFNIFHQSQVINLYPKLRSLLSDCEIFFNVEKYSSINIPSKCIFFRLSFAESLFDMLYTQYFIHKFINNDLFFQCGLNGTYSDINATSLSLNFSHSIETLGLNLKSLHQNSSITSNLSDKLTDGTLQNIAKVAKLNSTNISENVASSAPFSEPMIDFTIQSSFIEPTLIQSLSDTMPLASTILVSSDISSHESIVRNNITSTVVPETKTETVQLPGTMSSEFENDLQALSSSGGQSKEAVIVRLTSRIKNLEKNISLMSTYLESLSVRYRKQMEEMQFIFNKTIDHLNNTAIRAAEKDAKQQEFIMALEKDINFLNTRLSTLSSDVEIQNLFFIKIHLFLMIFCVIFVAILCLIFYMIFRRILCSLPKLEATHNSLETKSDDSLCDTNKYHEFTNYTSNKTYLSRSKSLPDMKTEQRLLNILQLYQNCSQVSSADTKNSCNPICDSIDKENQRPADTAHTSRCSNNNNITINNKNNNKTHFLGSSNKCELKASGSACVENILKTIN